MAITRSQAHSRDAGADTATGADALPAARRRRVRIALLALAAAVLLAGAATAGLFGYLATARG